MAIFVLRTIPVNLEILKRIGKAIISTLVMLMALWPLRKVFIVIPFVAGMSVFILMAWKLQVLGAEEQQKLAAIVTGRLAKLRARRAAS